MTQMLNDDDLIEIAISLKAEHKTFGKTLHALYTEYGGRYDRTRAAQIVADIK